MRKSLHLEDIPYCPDVGQLFAPLRDLPGAALLDSAFPFSSSGRYDILTALPAQTLSTPAPGSSEESYLRFYNAVHELHQERYADIQPPTQELPFCGGLLGCLGYGAADGLHRLHHSTTSTSSSNLTHVNAYDWCVVQDHLLGKSVLVAMPWMDRNVISDLTRRLRVPKEPQEDHFTLSAPFSSNMTEKEYQNAFRRIQDYIRAGDCYQVNLAQRFSSQYSGDPWLAYRSLRAIAGAPFSAFLSCGADQAIMSLSPERFLALQGQHVTTNPIKGTRPRYRDTKTDRLAAAELMNSAKDRAENLMIVDLLRNDLGRSCLPGSIHVDKLFELQSYPTVHHLVSSISGELRPQCSAVDLLRDSFPGGSITGAPKRRAMEIIAELEPDPREAYCGSVFYISADGRMDSNIAIRTLVCREQSIHCWGGGGIVADSQWQQEYQETYDKVGRFLSTLEQQSGI
ncbi:MAG: aminodeoxychorismate synthase component I [Halioglobus sp.]